MDFKNYYEDHKTYIMFLDTRLKKIINLTVSAKPKKILDIGCGTGFLITNLQKELPRATYYGIDVYKKPRGLKAHYKVGDITKGLPYKNGEFDLVILGEVIEHVPNPDFILQEINRVLKKNGKLIVSTPNLVSWMNRILVLLGIQPLYTETSSDVVLGRFFRFLGQGNSVQGHLKIFTFKSLKEILEKEKFKIVKKEGVPFFFPFPLSLVDRFFTHILSLSSGLLYVAKKNK